MIFSQKIYSSNWVRTRTRRKVSADLRTNASSSCSLDGIWVSDREYRAFQVIIESFRNAQVVVKAVKPSCSFLSSTANAKKKLKTWHSLHQHSLMIRVGLPPRVLFNASTLRPAHSRTRTNHGVVCHRDVSSLTLVREKYDKNLNKRPGYPSPCEMRISKRANILLELCVSCVRKSVTTDQYTELKMSSRLAAHRRYKFWPPILSYS